ncbi:MAG TPA: hypothetical protein VIV11_17520 [Kofleriaceae bacterium]
MKRLALLAIMMIPVVASAEGERGAMFGGAVIATRAPETEVAGVQLELALWRGRIGVAGEGSYQSGLDERVAKLGASLRLLLYHEMTPSLLDPYEDVELGFELHGIVERAWWSDDAAGSPTSYGGGLVLRLRGDTDFTNILAESRLFVRALWSREPEMGSIARTSTTPPHEEGVVIVIGLGAVFGGGQPAYWRKFRPRTLDMTALPLNH